MIVAGVDEVGRGPLAGPVFAAAVVLHTEIDGLADSKTLPAATREHLAAQIIARSAWAIGAASAREIDRLNIRQASLLAMRRALLRLGRPLDAVLIDGRDVPSACPYPARAVPRGDASEPCIAAAAILAKVARDRLMVRLDARYPPYLWCTNKGYPTAGHRWALRQHGVTAHHRRSFAPVRAVLAG